VWACGQHITVIFLITPTLLDAPALAVRLHVRMHIGIVTLPAVSSLPTVTYRLHLSAKVAHNPVSVLSSSLLLYQAAVQLPASCLFFVRSISTPSTGSGFFPHRQSTSAVWTGPDWTGLDRTGPDWTVPDRTGSDRTGPDRTGLDRTGPDPTGLDRTGLVRTGLDRTGLDRTGLDWTEPDWTGLDWTGPTANCAGCML
jgi:hypothetical protein